MFGGSGHFAIHDAFVLLFLGVGLEALPWQTPTDEIHEDVTEGLQIVTARLFNANVCVDAGVSGSTGEVFVLPVGNVLVTSGIAVFFGKAKVDDVNDGLSFAKADEEVVGFDVAMDEGFGVYVFQAAEELISEHEDCFELEAPAAVVEEVFQGWTEEVKDHDVVVAFNAVPSHIWDSHCDCVDIYGWMDGWIDGLVE